VLALSDIYFDLIRSGHFDRDRKIRSLTVVSFYDDLLPALS
jgi:hypothetical protein